MIRAGSERGVRGSTQSRSALGRAPYVRARAGGGACGRASGALEAEAGPERGGGRGGASSSSFSSSASTSSSFCEAGLAEAAAGAG